MSGTSHCDRARGYILGEWMVYSIRVWTFAGMIPRDNDCKSSTRFRCITHTRCVLRKSRRWVISGVLRIDDVWKLIFWKDVESQFPKRHTRRFPKTSENPEGTDPAYQQTLLPVLRMMYHRNIKRPPRTTVAGINQDAGHFAL
ncbi:hypothetical protein CEXT_663291 [Caerostris extrusa]|uniref:Uncharacterized protein n=1 Tax=Caerostris extrusa TaxID=172846 RepID=A0AAV4T3X1_CAEEX|nr:hypothetical protein CEXT_663291 [Caerostris extrusa]